jgi:hypothetical protein
MPVICAEDEVRRLHVFFEDWMSGRLPRTAAGFAPFPAALAADFTIIGPDGAERGRDEILTLVEGLHGARGAAFRIWIEAARILHHEGGTTVVRSDERQHVVEAGAGCDTRRRCTAVLIGTSDGWRWLAVQETWVEETWVEETWVEETWVRETWVRETWVKETWTTAPLPRQPQR